MRVYRDSWMLCDLWELMVNLGNSKVMIFNCSKQSISDFHFYFWGEEVKVTSAYTYLEFNI
jgi:hypothetical protein